MQMGSQMKSKVLEEQVATILKQWHADVRERRKLQEQLESYSIHTPRISSPTVPSLSINRLSNKRREITEEEEEEEEDHEEERPDRYMEEGGGGSWSRTVPTVEMAAVRR